MKIIFADGDFCPPLFFRCCTAATARCVLDGLEWSLHLFDHIPERSRAKSCKNTVVFA